MTHYSLITFDFKACNVRMVQDEQEVVLQGLVKNPILQLVRGEAITELRQDQQHNHSTIRLSSLDASEQVNIPAEVSQLLAQFSDVFVSPKSLPPNHTIDHHIPLHPEAKPFKLKPYR